MSRYNLILLSKPFGVTSQFSGDSPNLSDYVSEKGFYPAGRLDKDSEGLLLLTNDGRLQNRISNPEFKMEKTYWAQVEGEIDDIAIKRLVEGVGLKDGQTRPATATRIQCPLPKRVPDIRVRLSIPTSWLELTIQEGKNRQVRRMTAAVGFPSLRLFRHRIGPWTLQGQTPGKYRKEYVNL
ncbi:pseudouridine synthase [Gammaproteobacteria bacterium]|nr:pseudouridine synthase [Gammaproteobacteria bacterium]